MRHPKIHAPALILVCLLAYPIAAKADVTTPEAAIAMPRAANATALRRFSEQELRSFTQLAGALSTQENQLNDSHSTQLMNELNRTIGELKTSLINDDHQQTAFSQENLRAHLFAAQEAAENALEIGVVPQASTMEVASANKR